MNHKFLRWIFPVMLMLIGVSAAHAAAQTSLSGVDVYTDVGGGNVRWEQGTLFSDENGFVPITSNEFTLDFLGLTPEVLSAISGKPVVLLNLWTQLSGVADLSKFKRSTETYTIKDVPYVILTVKGSTPPPPPTAGGTVLKLSLSGVAYCDGFKPRKITPKTAANLWLYIESAGSSVLYGDEGLSDEIAVLGMNSGSIAGNKTSFTAFSGDADQQLMILGIFNVDSNGAIKSVKATMLQNGVLDSCYSQLTVSGKRVANSN